MSTSKAKKTNDIQKVNDDKKAKKKEKLELSKGGMRSPKNSLLGKVLLWFLVIAMLSGGIAFLIVTIVQSFTRI